MFRIQTGTYKHYKGGLYNVLGTCVNITPKLDSKKEMFVLYQSKSETCNSYWLRPIEMFTNNAEPGIPRFEQINSLYTLPNHKNLVAFHTEEEVYYQVHFDIIDTIHSWVCYKL